ncbi:MAG TPA: hypothetical protein VI412_01260 [Tabrizicola sp.]
MLRFAFATALTAAALSPAQAEQIQGSTFGTGNWEGAAYTDDQTGDFLYCDVSVGYVSGEVVWLGLYNNDMLAVLLSHPDVRFQTGQTFDAWLMFETGLPIRQVAEAWDQSYAGMSLSGIDGSIEFLSGGQYLRLLGIGIDAAYDVTGITDALAMARACHAKYSGSNPFATIAPPADPPAVEAPPVEAPPVETAAEAPAEAPKLGTPMPKVPDLSKPKTSGVGTGGGLGTRPGGALGTPAPKPQP